jgi:hypothetical protein
VVFYTDTNGAQPFFFDSALLLLGMVMESIPLGEIDFQTFQKIATQPNDDDWGDRPFPSAL